MTQLKAKLIDELIQDFEELIHQLSLDDVDIVLISELETQRALNIRAFFTQEHPKFNSIPTEKFTRLGELDKLIIKLAHSHKDKLVTNLKQFKKNNKAANAYKNF